MAVLSGAVVGVATVLIAWFMAPENDRGALIGGMLLNMTVFGAMISYAMQGLSFILLRRNLPNIDRPYRSPLGSARRGRGGGIGAAPPPPPLPHNMPRI